MPTYGEEESKSQIATGSEFLHWSQRTEKVQQAIDGAYSGIKSNSGSEWGYFNGASAYGLSGVDDWLMIERMVLENLNKGKKEFVALDIGAGDFQWGQELVRSFNKNPFFKENGLSVSIYSLRGERSGEKECFEDGICTRYEYGNFKIENLVDEFQKRGHDLSGKVDMAVSSWCLRHLVDPVGTLLQAYSLLAVETGLICFDGFFVGDEYNPHSKMISLLQRFDAPFIEKLDGYGRRINCFVMGRSSSSPKLDISYDEPCGVDEGYQVGSRLITNFNGLDEWEVVFPVAKKNVGLSSYCVYLPEHEDFFFAGSSKFFSDR